MFETVQSIAVNYWAQVLFGLIAGGFGYFFKRYLKLEKADRAKSQKEFYSKLTEDIKGENSTIVKQLLNKYNEVSKDVEDKYTEVNSTVKDAMAKGREESKKDDKILQDQITHMTDEFKNLRRGVLSIQGKEFKADCRRLLQNDHVITLEEWEDLDADHETYNALGGNHNGDHLYSLVKKKVENSLLKEKED